MLFALLVWETEGGFFEIGVFLHFNMLYGLLLLWSENEQMKKKNLFFLYKFRYYLDFNY